MSDLPDPDYTEQPESGWEFIDEDGEVVWVPDDACDAEDES